MKFESSHEKLYFFIAEKSTFCAEINKNKKIMLSHAAANFVVQSNVAQVAHFK